MKQLRRKGSAGGKERRTNETLLAMIMLHGSFAGPFSCGVFGYESHSQALHPPLKNDELRTNGAIDGVFIREIINAYW